MNAFVVEQKVTLMVNQYRVFRADEAGEKHELVAFAQQKRFALREHFDFYTDESRQQVLFSAQARQVIDLGTRYDVTDASGKKLGVLGKVFRTSLLRSTWKVFAPDNEDRPLAIVRERSKALAFFRRLWEFLPYVGDIPFFVKYHFDFINPDRETVVASYNKTTTFRDHYLLHIENELADAIDWRPLVALGVLLDALQSR